MSTSTTAGSGFSNFSDFDEAQPLSAAESQTSWIVFGAMSALILVAYFDMLKYVMTFWNKGLYSHGWIVPMIAAYLFMLRKKPLVEASSGDRWAGVGLIAVCLAVRVWASYFDYNNPDRLSFIGCLLGLCLIVGGRSLLAWAGPTLAFLIFMFPFPAKFENTMLVKLQTGASIASTAVLQTLGVSASRMGNVISIDTLKEPLTVAEACSGLRMLTIFIAMSVALVMTMNRPWWDRLIVLLSAIPIALISNMIRIVLTGLLFMAFGQDNEWLGKIIHDWAGFAMMPIGLGLLFLEMAVLSRLTIPVDEGEMTGFGGAHLA
jgi:exosortase